MRKLAKKDGGVVLTDVVIDEEETSGGETCIIMCWGCY